MKSDVASRTKPEEPAEQKPLLYKLIDIALWCVAIALPFGLYFYFVHWHSDVALADFKLFYQAALDVRHGSDPFQPAVTALHSISKNPAGATGSYFVYPIPFALLFVPLTFLPLQVAALIWTSLSVLSLLLTMLLLVQIFDKQDKRILIPILMIGCSLIGIVRNELKLGQVDIIITFLVASNYFAYLHKRSTLSGVLLALAIIVKPYLALILLFYLWKRAYRVVISSILTCLICFGIAVLVVGWQENLQWIQVANLLASVPRASQVAVVSLYSLFLRLFAATLSAKPWIALGTWPAIVAVLLLGGVVVALVLRIVRRTSSDTKTEGLEFALWLTGSLLIFPELEDIHITPGIIALVIVLLSVPWTRISRYLAQPTSLFAVIVFLYFLNPLLPSVQWADNAPLVTGWHILETGAYFLGLVLLFSYIFWLLIARSSQ